MLKKSLVMLLAVVLVAVLLAGCSSKGPAIGGVLVQPMDGVIPGVFNTMLTADAASAAIEGHIFEGLIRLNQHMEPVGLLASKWEISPDNLEWTFYLKEGVKWHDGMPFTAHDVQFTYETMAFNGEYPGPWADNFRLLENIEVLDDLTVKFILSQAFAPFMDNLDHGIMPRHIFDPQHAEGENMVSIADMFSHPANLEPVGTGPWLLAQGNGNHIDLVRNENYHGRGPYIATKQYKFIQGADIIVSALEAGVIDMIPAVPDGYYERLMTKLGPDGADSHEFYESQRLAYDYLGFNHWPEAFGEGKENPFTNLRVRQALAHGINRQQCIDTILNGRGTIMDSSIPPSSWAYAEERVMVYEYDSLRAAQLLDEAGWLLDAEDSFRYKTLPDGSRQKFEFTITLDKSDTRRGAVAVFAQEQWRALGMDVTLDMVDRSVFLSNYVIPGNYEMIVMGWSLGRGDPDGYTFFHSTQNDAAYNNSVVDSLLERGRTIPEIEARREIYANLQAQLSYDLPYIFLFTETVTTVINKKVQGVVVGPLGPCCQESWYIEE